MICLTGEKHKNRKQANYRLNGEQLVASPAAAGRDV